jgi:Sigma-70, region 4
LSGGSAAATVGSMNEPGQTSVTPPPWWELTGQARISALLAAARSGDEAAWSDLVDTIQPFLRTLSRGAGIDAGDSTSRDVYARLRYELDGIADEDALITWVLRNALRGRSVPYAGVDRTLSRLSDTDRQLLWLTFRGKSSYADIARYLAMPVGAVGPTRARLLKKIWRLSTSPLPPPTSREDLEAALRIHRASRDATPPGLKNGWIRTLARAFGLVPPPRTRPAAGDDLVVAACRDVTDATRETLRDFAAVLVEHATLAPGDRR